MFLCLLSDTHCLLCPPLHPPPSPPALTNLGLHKRTRFNIQVVPQILHGVCYPKTPQASFAPPILSSPIRDLSQRLVMFPHASQTCQNAISWPTLTLFHFSSNPLLSPSLGWPPPPSLYPSCTCPFPAAERRVASLSFPPPLPSLRPPNM